MKKWIHLALWALALVMAGACGNDKMSEEEMAVRAEREYKDALAAIEEANADSPIPSMQLVGDYLVFSKKYPEGWQVQYDYGVVAPQEPSEAPQE